jgi:hypothetical protein
MRALAPEVCFSPDPEFFRSLFSRAVEPVSLEEIDAAMEAGATQRFRLKK